MMGDALASLRACPWLSYFAPSALHGPISLMLDLVVELFRHVGVDALEGFVLGHGLGLVVDGVVSECEVEVSLGQVWSQLDHFLVRLNRFRVATRVIKRESKIEMSGRVRWFNL